MTQKIFFETKDCESGKKRELPRQLCFFHNYQELRHVLPRASRCSIPQWIDDWFYHTLDEEIDGSELAKFPKQGPEVIKAWSLVEEMRPEIY